MLPFTTEQFFGVFGAYNDAIWPMPIIAYGLAVGALAFLVKEGRAADRVAGGVLGFMWLWTGIAYHWWHFAAINPGAVLFGAAFVAQGAIIAYATARGRLAFGRTAGAPGFIGAALVGYSAIAYPLIGAWFGHGYPAMATFGVTPCPVTIFTFGCLMFTTRRVPWWVWIIPLGWSAIGGSAAFLLGVPQDWMLAIGAVLALAFSGRAMTPEPSHSTLGPGRC
jgi:hypothetical protein